MYHVPLIKESLQDWKITVYPTPQDITEMLILEADFKKLETVVQ